MATKVKRIPNVFESLYHLAKYDSYDSAKWRDMLTGIHRKYKDKHSIRDICLLYYALFKGHSNNRIAHIEIKYKDRESREYLGPLKIRDIADAYLSNVSSLIKFMNTKQLAIISKYLLLFNKLDESICNTILSRISSNHLRITPRSFCNIVLALSESNNVNSDSVERLLMQNKSLLSNMNRIDLMYILKSISIHNINNSELMNILSDKLNYYIEDMSANEVLSTLYSIYRLNWHNEPVITSLYFKIQNLINEYNVSSLLLISKCLSHFNLKDIREFFDVELIPRVHHLMDTDIMVCSKTSGMNHNDKVVDELLLLYKYCYSSGSTLYPKMLNSILDKFIVDYQWQSLFTVLYRYQKNIKCSSILINSKVNSSTDNSSQVNCDDVDVNEYVKLVLKSIEGFKRYISTNKVSIKYLPEITKCMAESGFDRNDVLLEIIKGIDVADIKLADYFVDTLFNLHTVDFHPFNTVYNELISLVLNDKSICDYGYLVPIMSILFYRNRKIPSALDEMFKSVFNKGRIQTESWKVLSPEYTSISSYKKHKMDICDEVLEYLLYTLVFPMKTTDNTPSSISSGCSNISNGCSSSDDDNNSNGSNDNNGNTRFLQYKNELAFIFKTIKRFKRGDLLKIMLWYIGEIDEKVLKKMLEVGIIPCIKENLDTNWIVDKQIEIELVESASVPRELGMNLSKINCLLIKLDGELVFKPCYLESGTKEVYYNQRSREKWDSVSMNMLRSILELNSYGLKLI
ncbi:hypothetical protein MACK_000504 [Theileria orientalis]|uniref:RNA-editing substrate-binding complex 6 protein domain-containing protein n=1 Tax=Theileria orientalis TaxID=68886 RepID=A0A976MA30_THEOR|nr:hypothetical protein MACK_000504 [Theileria orientalis]